MTMTLTERLVHTVGGRTRSKGPSRRGFLGGAAVVGAALALNPWGYLVRPANAYDAVCGSDAACADGYSVFCCTINGGSNTCPPNSFIGGWWKADNSSFCGGSARYYIDCNAYHPGDWQCRCAEGTCDQRRVACNQFRYGQCNTQIPMSQSGPVVCRMVSCTPPWQQFGGTCTSSSATDNKTATHAAPCLLGRAPLGSLDIAGAAGNAIRLAGWAFDPDQPGTQLQVVVYIDNVYSGWYLADKPRTDVNAAFGVPGDHGYDITIPAAHGTHAVRVHAVDVGEPGPGNPAIGSSSVTVGAVPIGYLDVLAAAPNSRIRIRGWAFDPDQPGTDIQVAVWRDGAGVAWFPTGGTRGDVNSAFGITGNHGFDFTIDSPPGDHSIQIYAQNVGGGLEVPLIGTGQVRVGLPMGYYDSATVSGRTVTIRGWVFDPDQPDVEIPVAVYRNGWGVDWFPTGRSRPDVNAVFGITGNHGFEIVTPADPGQNVFEIFARNIGPAAGNPSLGARAVQVQ
ncbi:MAG TPA: twin-arginine translocation signal domain-containing protein [Mycobacterium sp.]